ncbi:MAG: phosphatidylserine/phosphatidylglycerophosphate/cardiolipin synthase family protein [Erythrobacter sp.]|uniref:phospholipase D-like domain-containing protein n=1 Tax=Erythrobacter sp. TaxID=1042 RepID=UPI0025D065FE|nr:phosphatidylserine/phosphatidylglycerophosphate/cardiolipin synthase family protein [Erythrobacter sp.]MCM0000576.1 phosphatidylserine/phosphatidylglycerophosphate/cardiolipin synthase family protein [Erythrobacter sp.]
MASAPAPAAAESPERAPDYCDLDPFSLTAAGHDFTFYPHGQDRLKALVALIESAQTSLAVFYYLFDSDTSGTMVRDALVAAARRGVKVDLIVDDFGNDAGAEFFDPLVEAGGSFAIFSPKWGKRYLVRNHQKFTIADEARVMTGGANVSDHYFAIPAENGWCDLSVLIEGPVAAQFTRWFGLLQSWVANEVQGRTRKLRALRDIVKDWDGGDGPVRLLVGGPLVRQGHWAWVLRKDLVGATRLDTVSAYFSPPRSFRRLFARIGRRGQARMIMAGKSDIAAAIDMARLLYGKLLRARVKIFEFAICKLHMKLIVVDDVAFVGSANLDKRSFRINVELMVRIEDAAVAAAMRNLIDHMAEASEPITPAWYARHSTFLNRLRWRVAYWLSLADYRISKAGTV